MKRTAFVAIFCAFVSVAAASAQNMRKWELCVGIAYPMYDRETSISDGHETGPSEIVKNSNNRFVDRDIYPSVTLSGGVSWPGENFGCFINVAGDYATCTLTGGYAPLYEKELIMHFLPELRLYYSDRHIGYLSLAAGLRYRHFSETIEGDRLSSDHFGFSYQFTPVGISIGDTVCVVLELGFGRSWSGAKLGLGYRF